jgi:hypothetical protein
MQLQAGGDFDHKFDPSIDLVVLAAMLTRFLPFQKHNDAMDSARTQQEQPQATNSLPALLWLPSIH